MDTSRIEHRTAIHEARNSLGDVISRARYAGESTILTNRGKEAAVIVSYDFYEQAKATRLVMDAALRVLREVPEPQRTPAMRRLGELVVEATKS
jgi:prevent-host-death family protein